MKKIFKTIYFILSIIIVTLTISVFTYSFFSIKNLSEPTINVILEKKYSKIFDKSNNLIETLGKNKKVYIKYEDIPQVLIDALVSVEDKEFFYHDGLNYKRIFSSIFNNITSNSTQGGSTLTQQLVKNLLLTNEHSLKRKIQEAYLATLLEKKMTKEEILEFYFNEIYFEGSIPGIVYASNRYFNKSVSSLSLVEAALLVGLVKSPTYYSPYLHPDNAENRKNTVLKAMLNNHKITQEEYDLGIKKSIEDSLVKKGSTYKEETYQYQAYLDIVYKEVENLTGYNPFSIPMEIETYLDTSLQNYLDQIQKGEILQFKDDIQQIGACVLNNNNASVIGVIGGRNYDGLMLFNHAYSLQRQPGSTLKPTFTYALAMEYLNYNEYTLIEDKPYTYPHSNITVQNADKNYLGDIPLVDAIGYSRNTSTLYTLEKLINKIGISNVTKYLKDINIMDEGPFTYPYAIGGMSQGISPTQLAGSYCMLARNGNYLLPSTIKSIRLIETNEVIYNRSLEGKQVLSNESAYKITSTLKKVMDDNYYNISYAKPSGITVCAKTGTNAYDDQTISKLHYPSYADKDVWFAGYSKNYSLALWTGFDELNDKTYFGHNDDRRLVIKDIFRNVLKKLELKNQYFEMPSTLTKVNIVKGVNGNYLPNELIPNVFIVEASFNKNNIPTEVLPLPNLSKVENVDLLVANETLTINIHQPLIDDKLYKYIFGEKVYMVTYIDEYSSSTVLSSTNTISLPYNKKSFSLSIVETFKNNQKITSEPYLYEFNDLSIFS